MSGILYLVGTPIGNLSDFSPRAVATLEAVDFIAAEDTRVSMKLLNHFGIKKPLISYHQHNCMSSGQNIVERILAGENCALVTDAGMPAISDPGEDLVRLCAQNEIVVQTIPGPSAFVSALALSALPTGRFTFEGFLSTNKKTRRAHLDSLVAEQRTMIFYEAPHKLKGTLDDLYAAFGDRPISLSRELTKLHEETRRTTIAQAIAYYAENDPKGEFVLVIAGAEPVEEVAVTLEDGVAMVLKRREQGERMKDAVRQVSADTGLNKNELYEAALKAGG